MKQPSFDEVRDLFIAWFTGEYGLPPVITSSTGLPAVHFALHVLERYGNTAAIAEIEQGTDES